MTINELRTAVRLQGKIEIVRFDEESGEELRLFRTYDFAAATLPQELLELTVAGMYGASDEESSGIVIEVD